MLPSGAASGPDVGVSPGPEVRPGGLTSRLELDGSELDLSLMRVGLTLDAERQKADVSVFHPGFATIPEQARGQATYLLLDWLLGEDGVERWLGAVQAVTVCPVDALPADALPETVLALAARTGDHQWALLEGQRDPFASDSRSPSLQSFFCPR